MNYKIKRLKNKTTYTIAFIEDLMFRLNKESMPNTING